MYKYGNNIKINTINTGRVSSGKAFSYDSGTHSLIMTYVQAQKISDNY